MTGRVAVPLRGEARVLTGIILVNVLLKLVAIDQPIYENYIGRQVPTAMVARNLDRGEPFGYPLLDTGPFPSYFLIEPPLYAWIVARLHGISGLDLEAAGRLVSGLGSVLALWGLYGLARRRGGVRVALAAALAFALFPITIRYGRAFQPDFLSLGCALAGLRCWDDGIHRSSERRWPFMTAGWTLIASAIFMKGYLIIYAAMLLPYQRRLGRRWTIVLAGSTLMPCVLWYMHALQLQYALGAGGSSAVNFETWLVQLLGTANFRHTDLLLPARFLIIRGFTPVGFLLGTIGLVLLHLMPKGSNVQDQTHEPDRWFWRFWAGLTLGVLLVFRNKLHHEYYFLLLAPLVAAGFGFMVVRLESYHQRGRRLAMLSVGLLVALGLAGSASTWRTPPEWRNLDAAARYTRTVVSHDAILIAPEPLLYAADRRGCRLAFDPASVLRAAREWNTERSTSRGDLDGSKATLELIELYRSRGARYLADLGAGPFDDQRREIHERLRRHYVVLIDQPEVFILDLAEPLAVRSDMPCQPRNPPGLSRLPTFSPGKRRGGRSPF